MNRNVGNPCWKYGRLNFDTINRGWGLVPLREVRVEDAAGSESERARAGAAAG